MSCLLLLWLCLSLIPAHAGKLSNFERKVDSESKDADEEKSSNSHSGDENSVLGNLLGSILLSFFEEDEEEPDTPYFSKDIESDTAYTATLADSAEYIPRMSPAPYKPNPDAPHYGPMETVIQDDPYWTAHAPNTSQHRGGAYRWGYGLWPMFQADYAWHWPGTNQEGERLRIELGYYGLMLALDYLWWTETLPKDSIEELEQLKLQLGLRIPLPPYFRVDLMGGMTGLEEESNVTVRQNAS